MHTERERETETERETGADRNIDRGREIYTGCSPGIVTVLRKGKGGPGCTFARGSHWVLKYIFIL